MDIEEGSTVSANVWRQGIDWAKQTFGKSLYKSLRVLGKVGEHKTVKKKAQFKVTFRGDNHQLWMRAVDLQQEKSHAEDLIVYLTSQDEEYIIPDSEEEPEEPETKEEVEEKSESESEDSDEERDSTYRNPCPFSTAQVTTEQAKHAKAGFEWTLSPRVVDPKAAHVPHQARSNMENHDTSPPIESDLFCRCHVLSVFCIILMFSGSFCPPLSPGTCIISFRWKP
jgi:hypothetical protein